jgi:hypothetical protein
VCKPFSEVGDSGSVIFDLRGRIVDIMSSGMGITDGIVEGYDGKR